MNKIHQTKDGERMYISQMEDDHLVNYIKLQCKNIKTLTAALGVDVSINPVQAAIYKIDPKRVSTTARDNLPKCLELIYPYLAEACLRGLPEATIAIQDALGRKIREQAIPVQLSSSSPKLLRARAFNDDCDTDEDNNDF